MMRRRRVGRPGLVGTMARTAVIAGTATAVSGGVARRGQARAEASAAQHEAEIDQEVDARMAQMAPPPPPAPAAAPAGGDTTGELQRLAELKAQGLLTDEEFAAAKAKLLGL